MSGGPELDEYKPKADKEPHKPIRSAILRDSLNLGYCPVNQTTSKTVELYNANPYQVDFEFLTETISVQPYFGVIQPKSKVQVTLQFTPQEAIAITEKLILNITEEQPRITYVSATGKYPYLSVDNAIIQFEKLLVGKCSTQELLLKNCSQVPARFQIFQIKDDDFLDNSFSLGSYQGEIAPQEIKKILVTYQPHVQSLTSVAHYRITCPGGNEVVFECVGQSAGFDVSLNTNSINFGEIKIGESTSRLLTIHNDSDLPIVFEFYNDKHNIFGLNRTKGRIKPRSHERIIINFNPNHTICYYERIFCMVRNHTLLYVDLMGTCYDLLIKPLPILQKHIDAFRKRVVAGKISEIDFRYMENAALMKISHTMSPSPMKKLEQSNLQLSALNRTNISQGDLLIDQNNPSQFTQKGLATSSYIPAPAPNQIVLHKELFQPPNSSSKLIILSEEFLDFNFCEFGGTQVTKELVLKNSMACKMTIFWTIYKHEGMNFNQQTVFSVYPETATLKPNSEFVFQVHFKPAKSQYYFYQRLQFFAFKYSAKLTKKILEDAQKAQTKTLNNTIVNALKGTMANTSKMRSEDITADETIPPYNGFIGCVGHSFGSGSQPYIPILEVYPSNSVYFAACSREESQYQTIEIHNTSDTPTYFKFSPDVEQIFKVFPNSGLIAGKSFMVIVIEFVPKEFKAYDSVLTCHLNHNLSNVLKVKVHGYASEPELSLQNSGRIFFPPSYTGVYSRQKVKVQNLSRIELQYQIDIPEKYSEELYLEPSSGLIKPNETIFLDCSFVPYRKKDYKINVPLSIIEVLDPSQNLIGYHLPGSGNSDKPLEQRTAKEVNYNFEIFGAGRDGSLSIEPENMDFDIVKVNFNKKNYATLHNYSNCTFYIELKLRLNEDSETSSQLASKTQEEVDEYLRKNFTLDFEKGIIAANSKIDVGIMFNPNEVGTHDIILDVIAKEKNPMVSGDTKYTKKLLCQKCSLRIQAKGSYPLLKICDVRNVEVSVATLWENFQINRINEELGSQLNEDEKQFLNIEQLNFTEAAALQKRLKSYDWNFGYLPNKVHAKPRKIVITIQNIGGTECDWSFKLPSDNQIEVEPWADPGEPTEEDAFEKAIIERNIFQIQPKMGTLQPGELQDIILVYSPGNSDESLMFNKKQQQAKSEEHFLRVILQIINGKPLCINLRGMTLAPLEGRLAVKKNHYILPDTPIGLLVPVQLPIEIQNVGSSKINYRVEITELDKYGKGIKSKFDIFSVENSQAALQPGEKQYLYTQFRPLETKTYYHELKIMVYDYIGKMIQEAKIKVEGNGYGKNPPKAIKQIKADIPSQRSHVSTIGSKVCFSIEEIDFGELLPGKAAHRIIILYNLSETNRLHFDFQGPNLSLSSQKTLTCGDDFKIEPLTSKLNPGAWCELKLTLIAKETPSVYEGEIECAITWDSKEGDKEEQNNKFSHLSQPSSSLNPDRETLFLRIKKHSSLDVDLINSYKPRQFIQQMDKHLFEIIMENVIHDVINEAKTNKILERIDDQPVQLYSNFDGEEPSSIETVSQGYEQNTKIQLKNFKDYRELFMEDEFIDLVDLIMENTYFNIIQETTRGECDLLRISKTFVMPSNK